MAYVSKNYSINEGNKIGYLPSEFGAGNSIIEKKMVAKVALLKGQLLAITGDFEVSPSTSTSTTVIGVAMFDTKIGEPVSIDTEGLFKLTAGATITAGAVVSPGNDGKVIVQSGTTQKVGIALASATTDGDVYVKFSI